MADLRGIAEADLEKIASLPRHPQREDAMWEMAGRIVQAYHLAKDGRGEAEMASEEGTNAGHLNDYWAHGEGSAKIGWGADGDFDRCRAQLGKYIHDPHVLDGHCANLHHKATGAWPGHAPGEKKDIDPELTKDWAKWDAEHEGHRVLPNTYIGRKDKSTGERDVIETGTKQKMGSLKKLRRGQWQTTSARTGEQRVHGGRQSALDHLSTDFVAGYGEGKPSKSNNDEGNDHVSPPHGPVKEATPEEKKKFDLGNAS